MLTRLRAAVAARSLANVECVEAGLLTYEHTGELADFAYSRYALHHLPDFWKALALTRLNRALRPPERRAPVVGCGLQLRARRSPRARGSVVRHRRRERGGRLDPCRACGTRPRRALDLHMLLEPMIERAGFVIEAASYSNDQFSAQYVLRKATRPE